MPRFIDNLALRTVTWLITEAFHNALAPITRKLDRIMAAVQVEQADLDQVGDTLTALAATLNDVDTTPLAQGDESKLNDGLTAVQAAVSKLLGSSAPVTPPADENPPTSS